MDQNSKYRWKPILDYEQDPSTLNSGEIRILTKLWNEQHEKLSDIHEFNQRINRRWAIETGLIERIYSFDKGTTETLIERGLNAAYISHRMSNREAERTIAMIHDQQDAIEFVFSFVKQERQLSTSFIKELHALFTKHQKNTEGIDQFGNIIPIKIESGKYKTVPNNPTRPDGQLHEYCPPEHVNSEMDRLIAMHIDHMGKNISPEVEAAWLHHRFVQIHPFTDGNGRVARALATLVLIQGGVFPLVIREENRSSYIDALEKADLGKLNELVEFFVFVLKRELFDAFSILKETHRNVKLGKRLKSIEMMFAAEQDHLEHEWKVTSQYAEQLHQHAHGKMTEIKDNLCEKIPKSFDLFVHNAEFDSPHSHYYRNQIITSAREFNYDADTDIYRSYVRLCFKENNSNRECSLLVSFHGIGYNFKGVFACTATWFEKVQVSSNESEIGSVSPVCKEVFLISAQDEYKEMESRFENWLVTSLEQGLSLWQRTIPRRFNHM